MNKIRFGVFGLWRGEAFVRVINTFKESAVLVSVCDRLEERCKQVAGICEKAGVTDVKCFSDFDSFIDSGIDVVVLCNNFHMHAPYAICALKKGIHVISECTTGSTIKQCVELCRAVEKSGCKYMIAENYPFTNDKLEMARLCREGYLGIIQYAEGEYNHPSDESELRYLTPYQYHWRAWMPRTYYVTHAMGPLMYMTNSMPVTVNARAVHSPQLQQFEDFRPNYDSMGMMFCMMDNGALFRFSGSSDLPTPSGYRVVGERGSAECGRLVSPGQVYSHYNHWQIPDGMSRTQMYSPIKTEVTRMAENFGHGGGDYYIIYNMIEAILHDTPYFFDVYKGAAMSATAIYGWRSVINDGATYHIPDFSNEEERKKVENDDFTPFPQEDGSGITLPCSTLDAKKQGYNIGI